MDILQDDINREFAKIKEKIDLGQELNEEDMKTILLAQLHEEDLHERE